MSIIGLLLTYLILSSGVFWFLTAVFSLLAGLVVSHTVRLIVAFGIATAVIQFYCN